MSITIEELRRRKEEMEVYLHDLLKAFHQETGVHIDRIEVSADEFHLAGEERPRRLLRGVRVRLDMGLT